MILLLFFLFFISGCANLDTVAELNPKVYYKPDVEIKIDGEKYYGWGVLPKKERYKIDVRSPGEIDLIRISTCARVDTNEPGGRIFHSDKTYRYEYEPNFEMEFSGACPLRIETFEAGVPGRHSHGVFEFQSGIENVEAEVTCNGRSTRRIGVSMCVSMEGIDQRIVFAKPMDVTASVPPNSPNDRVCPLPQSEDKKVFQWALFNRECLYVFREIGTDNYHRYLAIGYEEVPVRKHR